MNQKLLDKWLNGELSASEMEAMRADPVFAEYLKMDSFVKRLELPSQDISEGLKDLKAKRNASSQPKVFKLSPIIKFAAAAAVILMMGYFYMASLTSHYETQVAETQRLQLPDRSQVILNENSQLQFDKKNWNENRTLQLTGEAYFEVAKGEVFDVHSKQGIVSVLGTKFNILDRSGTFSVVCYEGLVQVVRKDHLIKLAAGESVSFTNDSLLTERKYTSLPAWIHNETSFEKAKITWVITELESLYDINIITENIDVDLQYTGSFTNTNLEAALQTITLSLGLDYVIENKNVTIFAKE